MVVLFVIVTVTNIMSLNCNIPIPLHTVFKSVSMSLLICVFVICDSVAVSTSLNKHISHVERL